MSTIRFTYIEISFMSKKQQKILKYLTFSGKFLIFRVKVERKLLSMKTGNKIRTISSLVIFFLILSSLTIAQNTYQLDFADPTTYSVTCGSVNPAQWTVKNDSCLLYTPYLYPTGTEDSINVKFIIRINQSGNLDATDNCYIQHQINDGTWVTDTALVGLGLDAVFTLDDSMKLSRTDFFRFRIAMETNDQTQFWAIKDGDIIISNVSTTGTLPVEFLEFSGKINNDKILLSWSTASEVNNDFFTVENSENGVDFNSIGYVEGAGNSNNVLKYSYVDENPYEITYYRLKQTDYDGGFTYSQIIKVSLHESSNGEIIIIAANGEINVITNAVESGQLHVNVYSLSGALLFNNSINVWNGSNTINVKPDISGNSIYLVSVSLNGQQPVNTKVYMN